jgi:hypothetical protein
MTKHRWTPEMVETVRTQYPVLGAEQTALLLGVTLSALRQKAAVLGIRGKKYTNTANSDEKLAIIWDRYPDEGPNKLAEEFGVDPTTITAYANRMGLSLDKHGSYALQAYAKSAATRERNYDSLDRRYFDVWTAGMAYILGYTWADGSVRFNLNKTADKAYGQINFVCVTDDEEILQFIKSELKADAKISRYPARIDKRNGAINRPQSRMSLSHHAMAIQLSNDFGIEPRKSHKNLPFPNVPDEFLCHFARGNFDGDGCMRYELRPSRNYYKGAAQFLGTPLWMHGLRRSICRLAKVCFVNIHRKDKKSNKLLREMSWGARDDIAALYRFLYPEGDNYFWLKRKRQKFEEFLATPRHHHKLYTAFGKTQSFRQHCLDHGMPLGTVVKRYRRGIPLETALTEKSIP